LVAVANCINESLVRPGDRAARYGGEEFVVLLPDTSVTAAQVVAEAMRRAVSARAIEHALSEFGHVTISIGIATWPVGSPLGCKSLINAADEALYQAKATGRNRVAIYRWPDVEVGAALVIE
jgi:diguanylate cyclase (GGDEF)-like protein